MIGDKNEGILGNEIPSYNITDNPVMYTDNIKL